MNKPNENYYYIAGPGFNGDQLTTIHKIEESLNGKFNYFSPFKHGGTLKLVDNNIELNKLNVKLLYDENIEQLDKANKLIAVCDPLDKDTLFEVGYFIGSKYNTWHELSENILLYNDKDGMVSKMINRSIETMGSIMKSGVRFIVMDISKKTYVNYIIMGQCRAMGMTVVTWSNKPLDHNLMTACATTYHYQYDSDNINNIYDTPEKLQYGLITNSELRAIIFDDKTCNLSNMKFANKVE